MKSAYGTFTLLLVVGITTATIVPFALEGYPNCKCFCSKLPSLKELLCRKLCGPCSLHNILKSSVPTIRPASSCRIEKPCLPMTPCMPQCSYCSPCSSYSPCSGYSPCSASSAYCPCSTSPSYSPCAPSIPYGPSIGSPHCGSPVSWWE